METINDSILYIIFIYERKQTIDRYIKNIKLFKIKFTSLRINISKQFPHEILNLLTLR